MHNPLYKSDDYSSLRSALQENGLHNEEAQVYSYILELTGENDGPAWHWIVMLKNGKYAYVSGGCDYTGWDCQSHCDWEEADSLQEALRLAPLDVRRVFLDMLQKGEHERDNTGGL